MIANAVVREIRRLLTEGGLSQRKIAQRIGVSRGTVNSIARGKRRDYPTSPRQPIDDFVPPSGLPVRCPGCGGMAQMPCLACHVRALRGRRRPGRHR